MSDIFISYASQNRPQAQTLAQALTQHGWSVWWDRTIPSGQRFDQVIAKALADARCILVLWSKESLGSDWVIEEAEVGRKRHILVPVLIQSVLPPMGFRRIQAADLTDWDGASTALAFQKLVADIEPVLGSRMKTQVGAGVGRERKELETPLVEQKPQAERLLPERTAGRSRRQFLLWCIGIAAAIGGGYWVLRDPPRRVTVQVPSVVNRDRKEAVAILEKRGLRVGNIAKANAKGVAAGTVLDQYPPERTEVKRNSPVNLTVAQ